VQAASCAGIVIGLAQPGDRTLRHDRDRSALLTLKRLLRGLVADVVGVEGGAVVVDGPESTGELVGQCHGGLVVALALGKFQCPGLEWIQWLAGALSHQGRAQDGSAAVNEQSTQVGVASFGDAAQSSLVSGGTLTRDQPDPCGQVSP